MCRVTEFYDHNKNFKSFILRSLKMIRNDPQYKIRKTNLCIVATGLFLLAFFSIVGGDAHAKENEKYAAFIMDADTGLILHKENANKIRYPASLTKMMTLMLTFDALDSGKIKLNSRIHISKHAASMIPSKLGLKPGSTIRVKDAIYALSVKSANDIAVAMAEKLGGSEKKFAIMMTRKAKEIGMHKTRFRNASGLHDPRQVSTARDMARLGRTMVTRYKKYYHYFSKRSFTYNGKTYKSHNKLMNKYTGMDGLKTGYIRQSGFNLVASAIRNDRRLIGVVLGGKTGKSRNEQMRKLLDNAFARIAPLLVAKYNTPRPRHKPKTATIEITDIKPRLPRIINARTKETLRINKSRWAMLDADNENSIFNRMIGQGDYDINVRNRIETGLIAISAQMGENIPSYISSSSHKNVRQVKLTNITQPQKEVGDWAIQIGAFSSRDNVNKAIANSIKKLPEYLNHNRNMIAPSKTSTGWIFKGRLYGYTKASANDACKLLRECIVVSPNS